MLRRVRATAVDAYAHQDLPFEYLVEVLQPERDPARNPLFQVMFVLQNTPSQAMSMPELVVEPQELDPGTAKFDLTLIVEEATDGRTLEYNTDLFEAAPVARLAGHYQALLAAIIADPAQRMDRLPLLTAAEQQQIQEWNASAADYPRAAVFHELFAAQATHTRDTVALVFEGQQLSYGQLSARANQLARYLQHRGVGPDMLVVLCAD